MENQRYPDVLGTGTGNAAAPFLSSLVVKGTTVPLYHSYGASSAISGCSAACYLAFMGGSTFNSADGYGVGTITGTSFVDQLAANGLTWQAYCESSCPRGPDHFPFLGFASDYLSPNIFTSSNVNTLSFIAAAGSANPPNFLWYTPTDSNNMHDNSISTGDTYLKNFLVGAGSASSPASGSLLASSLFTSSQYRTLLLLWWDEFDPSPNVEYGKPTKIGYVSTANNYDEYASLHLLENNWGLPALLNAGAAPVMSDLFGSSSPGALSAGFAASPSSPATGQSVSFTASVSGGTSPYSYSWSIGNLGTFTGNPVTTTFATTGSYAITLTVTDSAAHTATSTQTITVTTGSGGGSLGPFDTTWYPFNQPGNSNCPGGTETLTASGVVQFRESSPAGDNNNYGYCTAQRGSFPWGSVVGSPLTGILNVTTTVNFLNVNMNTANPAGSRYHIYVGFYYYFPNAPLTVNGVTHQWFDTQFRIENINGVDTAAGSTATYDPGDSFGWDTVVAVLKTGQSYTFSRNAEAQYQGAIGAWGISPSTPHQFLGLEVGTEAFGINQLNSDWPIVGFNLAVTPGVCPNGGTYPNCYGGTGGGSLNLVFSSPVVIGIGVAAIAGVAIAIGGGRRRGTRPAK